MTSRLEHLTQVDVAAKLERRVPIVLPLGAVEQHGPHLPVGTDVLIAEGILERVAARYELVLAPAFAFATWSRPRTGGGRTFVGSIGMRSTTFALALGDVLDELFRQGFDRVVLLNGHLENASPAFDALEHLLGPGGRRAADSSGDTRAILLNWWDLLAEEEVDALCRGSFPGWDAEHAGVLETALMQVLHPELVRVERKAAGGAPRAIPYDAFPTPPDTIWTNGIGSTAIPASPELGEELLAIVVERIVSMLTREFGPTTL